MNSKFLTLILIIILINLSYSSKHASHTFEIPQKSSQELSHQFKNHKKARITQKQQFQIKDFITSLNEFGGSIYDFFGGIFDYFILKKEKEIRKQSVVYRQNFASQNGGSQILMMSSSKIKSTRAILKSDNDAYLFTADVLPITIVIGLKQEVLIDSFVVQSGEVYSCIVEDFMIEGAFSLQKQEWILLGNFTAQNSFEEQQFAVQQRIIRYLRLTILSSYGKWKYFTLTEVKVFGEGLFSHAMQSLLESDTSTQNKTVIEQNVTNVDNVTVTTTKKKVHHHNKFSNKEIHTKQILVQAFNQVAVEDNAEKLSIKHKQEHLHNNSNNSQHPTQQTKPHDSLQTHQLPHQKPAVKQKKAISNLKKKISYLQKRNYQMNQQIKQLRKITQQKIIQLQTKHHQKNDHTTKHGRNHLHMAKWYEFLFESHSLIYLSTLVNVFCIVLVGLVFKNKVFNQQNKKRLSTDEDDHVNVNQLQKNIPTNKNKKVSQHQKQQQKKVKKN